MTSITRAEPFLNRVVEEFDEVDYPSCCRTGKLGTSARRWIEIIEQVKRGVSLPDMVWRDREGKSLRISDLKGKIVIIDAGTLSMNQFARYGMWSLGPDQLAIIHVSGPSLPLGPDFELVPTADPMIKAAQFEIGDEEAMRFSRLWNIRTRPSAILIDREGKVWGTELREDLGKVFETAVKSNPEVENPADGETESTP